MRRAGRAMWLCAVMVGTLSGAAGAIENDRLEKRLAGISLPFIENSGQMDSRVAYYAATREGMCFVTVDGAVVYSLPSRRGSSGTEGRPAPPDADAPAGWVLTEIPIGVPTTVAAGEEADARVSIFHGGDARKWRPRVRTLREVSLGEKWPGVAMMLRAHGNSVEKIFTVEAGRQVDAIRMRIDGAECLHPDESGELIVETGLGEVQLTRPVAYQETPAGRQPVDVAYRLIGEDTYGFSMGTHNACLPVVIDPLVQATYLGGTSGEAGWAVAVHPINGDIYVAGTTSSSDFPGTVGGAQPAYAGGSGDVFVARLNPGLASLAQVTFIGGSSGDFAYSAAIHPATGNVYVAGVTFSSNFPGTVGGAQPAFGGTYDAFVVRLDAALTTLIQSTYLGGADSDDAWSIAVHPTNGDVYVAGDSFASGFPGAIGGAQPSFGGAVDGYVARLNPGLTSIIQATYLGGSGQDYVSSLAMSSSSGDVYVSGYTESTNLPGTSGGAQPTIGGGKDGFVARLASTLTSLMQATYLGGASDDYGFRMCVNSATGDVYFSGTTNGTGFPGTTGGAQSASGGGKDAYLARLTGDLSSLAQATYVGGTADDFAATVAVRPSTGDVYVAGETRSFDIPGTTGGAQSSSGGSSDGYVARFNSTLTSLAQATYLGGSDWDQVLGLTVHPSTSEIYVAGSTGSADFPGTQGGAQPHRAGPDDAIIARLTSDLRGGPTISSITSRTGKPGSLATLHGEGFSPSANKNKVYFGRNKANVLRAKPTSLKVEIPNRSKKGRVDVKAVVDGLESNTVRFTVE